MTAAKRCWYSDVADLTPQDHEDIFGQLPRIYSHDSEAVYDHKLEHLKATSADIRDVGIFDHSALVAHIPRG